MRIFSTFLNIWNIIHSISIYYRNLSLLFSPSLSLCFVYKSLNVQAANVSSIASFGCKIMLKCLSFRWSCSNEEQRQEEQQEQRTRTSWHLCIDVLSTQAAQKKKINHTLSCTAARQQLWQQLQTTPSSPVVVVHCLLRRLPAAIWCFRTVIRLGSKVHTTTAAAERERGGRELHNTNHCGPVAIACYLQSLHSVADPDPDPTRTCHVMSNNSKGLLATVTKFVMWLLRYVW